MKKLFLILAATCIVAVSGCKKFVEGEDISPNSPASATAPLLMSASELGVFSMYGGSFGRTSSMWAQQSAGTQFQAEQYDWYNLDEGDVTNEWRSIYETLKNLKLLKEKAGPSNPRYQGISNVLTASLLGLATDFWGDIPWSDALKGESQQYDASYDNQQDIIKAMQAMLSEAVTLLRKPDNVIEPGTDDFIYNGDAQRWIGFAYLLKARYAMRISKKDPNWFTNAINFADSAISNGFTSHAADANSVFGTNGNEYNQWYAFTRVERSGYMYMGKMFVDTMVSMNDPRVPFYFTENDSGEYAGSALGSSNADNVSAMGDYFASENSVTPLGTYSELLFIKAEALLAAGNKAGAALVYNEAVETHITHITGSGPSLAYKLLWATETAGTITLEKIMFQKYLSGLTMIEPYNDWRRTNIPTLAVNPKANLSGIARRFPTSIEERQYNSKAGTFFGMNDLIQRVWWDQ